MYTLVPVDWLTTKFDVYHDNLVIGKIVNDVPWFKHKSAITIEDKQYIAFRESLFGKWLLQNFHDKSTIATATKPHFFTDKFIIQFDSQMLSLICPVLSFRTHFIIKRNNYEIGTIKRPALVTSKWACTLKEEIPLEIVFFFLYLSRIVFTSRQ